MKSGGAIQMDYETQYGVLMEDAYIVLETIVGNKEAIQCRPVAYASRVFRDEGKKGECVIGEFVFTPDLEDEDNIFKQGYLYLMGLDVFSTGVEV